MKKKQTIQITDIAGIYVGHSHHPTALTGCTVILCPDGAVGGIDRRGGGTSTRQADGFEPWHVVEQAHGVLLTGGSAFGLGASTGVMQYLEEKQIGHGVGTARVPIVATAALFDLLIGDSAVHPDAGMAYQACAAAYSGEALKWGCVGAGRGATVGKIRGMSSAMKGGIGSATLRVGHSDLIVGAIVAVNAFGDVYSLTGDNIIAGVRDEQGQRTNTLDVMAMWAEQGYPLPTSSENTVIGVVVTNAQLTKMEATKVAQMAQDGLARVVRPAHLMFDGDTIFTLATGAVKSHVNVVGAYAAEVFAQAIVNGVTSAVGMGGLPAMCDLHTA